jgi:hypothetical protein
MKYIELAIELNDGLGIKAVSIKYNDTGVPNDSKLLKTVAITLLKSLRLNANDIELQDLLNDIGIDKAKP